jgi:hypothetical protein
MKKKIKKPIKHVLPFELLENRTPWIARELDALGPGWVAGDRDATKGERETHDGEGEGEGVARDPGRWIVGT